MKCPVCNQEMIKISEEEYKCPTCKTQCEYSNGIKSFYDKNGGDLECCENCSIEEAEYTYNEQRLCRDCLLSILEDESRMMVWTSKHYLIYDSNEYLGNDNDDNIEDIVEEITKQLKIEKYEFKGE